MKVLQPKSSVVRYLKGLTMCGAFLVDSLFTGQNFIFSERCQKVRA